MRKNKFWQILSTGKLFDTHAHLNNFSFREVKSIASKLKANNVYGVFDIAVNLESAEKSLEISKVYPNLIFPSVGIDPEIFIPKSDMFNLELFNSSVDSFKNWFDETTNKMNEVVTKNSIYLLGETGLDSYWLVKNSLDKKTFQKSVRLQERLFKMHIVLSKKYKIPLSIHSRNSIDKVINILEGNNITSRYAIFHSLTPDLNDTENSFYRKVNKILELGYFIGLNGIITYKSANILRNVIRKVLKENFKNVFEILDLYNLGFVFETDSPFLSPQSKRGEKNTPLNVVEVFNFLGLYM